MPEPREHVSAPYLEYLDTLRRIKTTLETPGTCGSIIEVTERDNGLELITATGRIYLLQLLDTTRSGYYGR